MDLFGVFLSYVLVLRGLWLTFIDGDTGQGNGMMILAVFLRQSFLL